ncbi:ankyrin-2-like isoform X1 [Pseudochaenichthys georgianus]|uniref:ankyrin-2-like isoform X1 n=1 Tax=Pseudochaenichthys georgianus TaxID=52239 RepID=UPI0039C1F21C
MSANLTAEQMEHSIYEERAGARGLEDKEPLSILSEEREEKVGGIQKGGLNDSRHEVQRDNAQKEKRDSIYETTTVEMNYHPFEEPVLQEMCIEGKTSRSAPEVRNMTGLVSSLSIDMDQYMEQRPVVTFSSQEDLVQDRFEQVIKDRDGKRRPPNIKKPIRKKLRDRERSGCSSSEGEMERMSSEESLDGDVVLKESALVPTTVMDPPASPLVVETSIGSIQDRVKALQNTFEDEKVQQHSQEPRGKSSIDTTKKKADMPELPRVPKSPKSPRSQTERLEETMSVKELMSAFQTGQDPSKNKAGLFEHKAVASSCISTLISESGDSDEIQRTEERPMEEPKPQTQILTTSYKEIDDEPVSLLRDNSRENVISNSAYYGKTVHVSDQIQGDNSSISPQREAQEMSKEETMSVKELMSAFQTGQDPSKNKVGLFEHKAVAYSSISTLISESGDSDEIQRTEERPMEEPKPQTQILTISYKEIDDEPVSLFRDNSHENVISNSAYYGKTVHVSDQIQGDNSSISPQREAQEMSKEETMSVKELMSAFQTGQDPSKNKAGLFEHKAVASSSISTLISESGYSDEIQRTEERPMEETMSVKEVMKTFQTGSDSSITKVGLLENKVESSCILTSMSESEDSVGICTTEQSATQFQTKSLSVFHPQSEVKKCETGLEDQPVSLIRDNSDESQLISDCSSTFRKTVTFAETVKCDEDAELTEKDTMSVKKLMKTFQTGHDPSKTKEGLFEHKPVDSASISTIISESGDSKEIQATELGAKEGTKSQTLTQNLTIVHQQSDANSSCSTEPEDQPVSLSRDNSEESQTISDRAYFGKTVTFAETVKCDEDVGPQKETSELSEKDTMSVKELLKTFQTGHDPSKTKAGLSEHKADTSCISTLIPESEDFEEIQSTEQSALQEPKSQTHTADSVRNAHEELETISDFVKTLKFTETLPCDDGSISPQTEAPELSGTATSSVKDLMKAFQTGQDLSKSKAGISAHKSIASSCISTTISESERPEDIQTTEHGPTQEPTFQAITLKRDNSEELQLVSDISYFGKTVEIDDTVQFDDGKVSPNREESEFSGNDWGKMQLEKPHISTSRSLSEDMHISPDRRPSEDFSADIKAELEESPEYQLFKRTSTAEDVSNQREVSEDETIADSNTNPAPISSPCLKSYFGGRASPIENQIKDDNPSPENPEHQDMADSLIADVDIRTPHASPEESDYYQGLAVTHQQTNEMLTYSTEREETDIMPSQEKILHEASRDDTKIDYGSNTFVTQTDTKVTEVEIKEPLHQEVHIERNTFSQAPNAVKDMSGMFSLMNRDLDQYLKARPVVSQSPDMDIVQETFEQIILTKEKDKVILTFVNSEKNGAVGGTAGSTTQKPDHAPAEEHPITWGDDKIDSEFKEAKKVKETFGSLSVMNNDIDQYLEAVPVSHPTIEEDNVQDTFETIKTFTAENKRATVDGTTQETVFVTENYKVTERDEEMERSFKETTVTLNEELPMEEKQTKRKISNQPSTKVKEMSGMLSLLNSDMDTYLKERPVKYRPQVKDAIQETFEQVTLTKNQKSSKTHQLSSTDVDDNISAETYEHSDVVEIKELTPGSVLETSFQEVCMEIHPEKSTTERDMSGMLSLLSGDLDQYLKEKPVAIQCQPEKADLVHESYKQVILTSSNSEENIDVKANEDSQTNVVRVTELSPSSVYETPLEEVCIQRKSQQEKSATERDMSGMLSLLSTDLNHYLKEKPMVLQCPPEEQVVLESYTQIIVTKETNRESLSNSPEHRMSPQETHLEFVDFNEKKTLKSGWQTCSHEDEGPKSFSAETSKAKTSPCEASYVHDSTDEAFCITKSYLAIHACNNDHKDTYLQLPSSSDTSQRPFHLENLNTVVDSDPIIMAYHQDSLEASPVMEDRSSDRSPDSIEPSPSRESPCPDSLEGSPTQSKESECEIPAKTAVYEDYASQLKACYNYDNNIYMDDSERGEPEINYEIIQNERGIKEDIHSCSESITGNMFSDSNICDSKNLHMCIRQDSLEADDSENDATNKHLTPEEDMFKMAAKIKTFDEMDQEYNMKRDKLETGDLREDHPDQNLRPGLKTFSQNTPETLSEATGISVKIKEEVENQSQLSVLRSAEGGPDIYKDKDAVEGDQPSVTETPFTSHVKGERHSDDDNEVQSPLTGSSDVSQSHAMVCTEEQESVIAGFKAKNDAVLNSQLEAEEHINISPSDDRKTPDETPVRTPSDKRTPDPFQFQEGKLFEMTRGGAIDMTRSFDEGEAYAFFHIGEHSVDEVVPKMTGEGQTEYLSFENSDYITETTLQECQGANKTIPTPKPRTLIKHSSDKSESGKPLCEANLGSSVEVQLGSPSSMERLTIIQSDAGNLESLGLGYLDSTIADLQSEITLTATSKRSHGSSESSPDDDDDDDEEEEEEEEEEYEEDEEDQCSVIEVSSAYHHDSPPHSEITLKDSQNSEVDCVKKKLDTSSTLERRTRSEADSDTNQSSIKAHRSYSDSSQPIDKSSLSPSKCPVMMQQKSPTQRISSFHQKKGVQLSTTTDTSVRSLDADDLYSPDSVIFTYDIPASHSSDSEGNLLPVVQPTSGREDVFESRPAWDDTVETQMQRNNDEPSPKCMPVDWQDDADRKEETLAIVADLLGFSWTELARELEFSENDIKLVRTENPNSLQEQSHALLQRWVEREGKHATEDCLIKRLTKINRMDIVHLIETQMNKSVQEQTSRTYAEIEKTLDHSEVSVALSLVQEDADSPRIVRRVESDRRPPPAVSEEDLSVASLLDITSWAEPAGHTHSESMHGDLLEDLEIPHELNSNLWTSEDFITQEPTSNDHSNEQVSTLSTSNEEALGSHATQFYGLKVKEQQDCCSVYFTRSFQGGPLIQSQVKDDTSQSLPLKQCVLEDDQGQSTIFLELPSSISVRDFGLSLSESDQAETDFSELCNKSSYTPEHTDTSKTIVSRCQLPDPSLLVLPPEDHQTTLVMTEYDTDVARKSRLSQKCTDVLFDHDKISLIAGRDKGFKHINSGKKDNTKPKVCNEGYWGNMPFIDDFIEPIIATAKYSMMKPFEMKEPETKFPDSLTTSCPSHMAFDSTDSNSLVQQAPEDDVTFPFTFLEYSPFTPDNLASEEQGSPLVPVNERGLLRRPSSPDSQTSQCSFSFVELLLSEPIRAQLMSQYCDYYLLYTAGNLPLQPLTSVPYTTFYNYPTELRQGDPLTTELVASNRLQYSMNAPSPLDKCYDKKSRYAPGLLTWQVRAGERAPMVGTDVPASKYLSHSDVKSIYSVDTDCLSQNESGSFQLSPSSSEAPKPSQKSSQSFLDYWFSMLKPDSSECIQSQRHSEAHLTNIKQNTLKHNEKQNSFTKNSDLTYQNKSGESCHIFQQQPTPTPMVFNLVERPTFIFEFPNKIRFDENRRDSQQSEVSDYELDVLFSSRALSPESISSDFDFSFLQDWLADFRASSPDYLESVGQHSFSCAITFGIMESEHCDYYLHYSQNRPVSPFSTLSDIEYYGFCLEELFDENRPDSPDSSILPVGAEQSSITISGSQPLSTARALTYADAVRGVTHESIAEALLVCKPFEFVPIWPQLESSDNKWTHSSIEDWVTKVESQSPKAVASHSGQRPLSPDSPVSQFRFPHICYDLELSRNRSFTPQSTCSDWEGTDLCLETIFDTARPDSPQSVFSDYELDVLFSSRALSPDSMSSDFDFSHLQNWLADFKVSSTESVASQSEHRPVSPDSPVPQYSCQYLGEHVELSRQRSFTPQSLISDWESTDLCQENLFDPTRPDSPQSVISDYALEVLFSSRDIVPRIHLF